MKRDFVTRFQPLSHGRLAFQEAGSGPAVLLIHGNLASKRWFHEQLTSPPVGWRLIALDLPNFGESDATPGQYSIDHYARTVSEFADSLDLERFVVVGHSLGGAVAQQVALNSPERVPGLVLIASAGHRGHHTRPEHLAQLQSLWGNREGLGAALAATAPSWRPAYFSEIVSDALLMPLEAYAGHAAALANFDVSGRANSYRHPVLVIRGELDLPHLISEEMARATAAAYPCATLELWDGVGHSPQLEAPQRFNRRLERFLEEVSGGSPTS